MDSGKPFAIWRSNKLKVARKHLFIVLRRLNRQWKVVTGIQILKYDYMYNEIIKELIGSWEGSYFEIFYQKFRPTLIKSFFNLLRSITEIHHSVLDTVFNISSFMKNRYTKAHNGSRYRLEAFLARERNHIEGSYRASNLWSSHANVEVKSSF